MKKIAVIGGANVDICGTALKPAAPRVGIPGLIAMSPGGVGRNIAQSLAALGSRVELVCALGRDERGAFLEDSCKKAGVGLSLALYPEGGVTSTYLCINDHLGDLITAISDMSICDRMTPQALEGALEDINQSDLVVLDANLPQESIVYLAKNITAPLAADPVSTAKCRRLIPIFDRLEAIKPNLPEARTLTGLPQATPEQAARALHDMGVKRVFLSLGAKGAYCLGDGEEGYLPLVPGPVADTTGCGDAFLSGALTALLDGDKTLEAGKKALAAAAIRAAGRDISPQAIEKTLKDGGVLS